MASSSIGTAWIQIKPSLKGVSSEIESELGNAGAKASTSFGSKFQSNFLSSAKSTFSEAFSEFGKRSDAAFSQFKTAAAVGLAAAGVGVIALAKQLDSASGAQQSFVANMKLAGITNEATAKTFKLLLDYANKSIYSLSDMTTTAGILASTGVKNAGELVRAFGNMAAAAVSPSQAIQTLSQQMAQVNGKGFVQTMDFRIMQEQAAGPMKQVTDKLREINGWSMADFSEALSKGKISAQMLNDAMLDVGKNPILEKLATQPRTITDAWEAFTSTLISNISQTQAWADLQEGTIGLLKKASEWISTNKDEINKWITEVVSAVKNGAQWINDNKELVKILLQAFVAFKALQIGVGAYRSAMDTLSPYYKLAKGGFQLMAGGVQTLTGKFKGLGAVSGASNDIAGGIDQMSNSVKKAPKSFTFGDSISSFFKNIGKTLSGAVGGIMSPLQTLVEGFSKILTTVLTGAGQAVAGFFGALANPSLLIGVLVFAAGAGAVALAIFLIGSAIGAVTPGLGDFLNSVLIPLGTFLMTVLVVALAAVTGAAINLTNAAIIPLINTVSGGLTGAFNAIGGVIQKAGDAVSGVVRSIADGIANVINSIANLLRSVGSQDWYGTGYGITRNFTAGLIDGLIDLLQDSLNKIINQLVNIPGVGDALKAVGVNKNPVNLGGFKLGRRAMGGPVFGAGGPTSDSIPMALSNGEYVIKAATAQKIGYNNLDKLNTTGSMGGSFTMGDIVVQGYNKDPRELANEISKIIALQRARVIS